MNVNLKCILTFLTLLFYAFLNAQTSQQKKLLPMLAPTSPETASLGRFGSYEVNLFTGVPDITIPLYNIKVGELNLPINISYHSSGIKVSETASRVGLGWSMQTGGSITRKIQGKPDEQPNCYFAASYNSAFRVRNVNEINAAADSSLDYLSKIDTRIYDGEPDIFSYSIPGFNGRFLFHQKDNFKPFLIPFLPIEVTKNYVDALTVNFALKDDAGRKYSFNSIETTTTGSGVGMNANTISAWHLSEILSSSTQDTIKLKYSPVSISDQFENEYFILNDNVSQTSVNGGYYNNDFGSFSGEIVNSSTVSQKLDSIIFRNGKVVIEEASESRLDFNGFYNLQHRIKFIKVYSLEPITSTYNLIKTVQFFHSYFNSGSNTTSRLRLDSIQIQTAYNTAIQSYQFSYNTDISLPGKMEKQKDYWGYFNFKSNVIPNSSTPTSIPKLKHTYVQPPNAPYEIWIGGSDTNARYPDPYYMKACILKQITYPTGGFTQFEYETNQYLDNNGISKYAGGLRIKSIKDFSATGSSPIMKTYKYGLNESGIGRANFFIEQYFFANHQNCRWVDIGLNAAGACRPLSEKTMHTYFANPTIDIEGSDGSPVVYSIVTEYDGDASTNNGKTIYQFSDKNDTRTSLIAYGKPYFDSYQFVRGLLTNKTIYKNSGGGNYSILSEERKRYQFFPYQWSTGGIGIVVNKIKIDQGNNGTLDNIGTSYGSNCNLFTDAFNYMYDNYNIVSGDNKIVTDTTIIYDQNDLTKSLTTITNYGYDDISHLGVQQTQTSNSKGDTLKSIFTFPYNYSTSTPYLSMTTAHIWNKNISETQFNGNTQIFKQLTNFSSFGSTNSLFLPSSIQIQLKSNPIETRALFSQYDSKGNILEMQKSNDIKQSYVWDYNMMLPIAEINGASSSDVAYTSFEADGIGGWSGINIPSFSINGSITGKRAYTQSNFSISKSGLNANSSYLISFWSKNGGYNVNGLIPTGLRTINGWTFFVDTIMNPSNGIITVSGTGTIDELRLHPVNSLMKTFTYDPLIGVTSICDENNGIQYFYHDGASRLILVKDDEGNILKKNCYNYYGQSGDCSLYWNASQNGLYTKNNCAVGYNGSQVTYTVPANTYFGSTQSEANLIAQKDVLTNGQSYANTFGNCTIQPITITGSNSKSISYTVKFTKSSNTSVWYSFSLIPGASNAILGQIPPDTYNIQFQPGGNPVLANFSIGSSTMTNVTAATFNNISLTTNSLARVY